MAERVDTVVIGAGQSGLSVSHHLTRRRLEHVVLERFDVGSTWARQRWDSFTLVTQNWQLRLPGFGYAGADPDGFLSRDEVIHHLRDYAGTFAPPIRCGADVQRVTKASSGRFAVVANGQTIEASNVVLANGGFPLPRYPGATRERMPEGIRQLHSSEYRSPSLLPRGAALVVGSGQSGTQIAAEIAGSGREVYLCVGSSPRLMRRYRGRDVTRWHQLAGSYDITLDELSAKGEVPPPSNPYIGIDLPSLSRNTGLTLLGRLLTVEAGRIVLADDLNENLERADAHLASVEKKFDALGARLGGPLDVPNASNRGSHDEKILRGLDLRAANVTSVIWATGYRFAPEWLDFPVWDENGRPVQRRGVTQVPGLYFLGLYYMHTLKSGLIFGVGDDADFIASRIANRLDARTSPRTPIQDA